MKIKFPKHLTGNVTQKPLVAVNLNTATNRAVLALQMQTGWKLAELREKAEIAGQMMLEFLTLHNAGFTSVTWDDILDLPLADVEFIQEPGDLAAQETGGGDAQGEAHPEGSPRDDAPATPRRAATRSKPASRGSRAKSAGA